MNLALRCTVFCLALLSVSGAQPRPAYQLLSIEPAVFPPNPFILWPIVRDMHQTRMHVSISPGAPLPTEVCFNAGSGPFTVPITGLALVARPSQMSWTTYSCTTPHMLVPHLLSGPVSVQARSGSVRSNRLAGTMP